MGNNKEIGKLIKDKFENFDVSPNDYLWDKIDSSLNENKKKRRFLLWTIISTLLSVLLLGVFVYVNEENASSDKLNLNSKENSQIITSGDANSNSGIEKNKEKNDNRILDKINDSKNQTNSIAAENVNLEVKNKFNQNIDNNSINKYYNSKGEDNNSLKVNSNDVILTSSLTTQDLIDNPSSYIEKHKSKSKSKLKKDKIRKASSENYTSLGNKYLDDSELERLSNNTNNRKKYSKTIKVIKMNEQHTEIEVVEKYVVSIEKTKKKSIAKTGFKPKRNTLLVSEKVNIVKSSNKNKNSYIKPKRKKIKKHINDFPEIIPEEKISKTINDTEENSSTIVISPIRDTVKIDSVKVANKIVPKKVLKPETKKKVVKEEEKKKEKGREVLWGIQPVIGENIIGNYTKSSLIGPTFDKFNTTTKSSFSYGFYVSFIPYDKFSIRTGVLKNEFLTENDLLNFNGDLSDISLSSDFYYGNYKLLDDTNNSKLSYKVNYFEFPLEIAYTFKKIKKFSFDFVLGASYVYVKSDDINFVTKSKDSYYIGESRQLKSSNYSVNSGVNAKYDLNNNFSIVINPMYRNFIKLPFDKTFNTFQISLQVGLLYKF